MASSPTSRCSRQNDRVFTPPFERCKRFLPHEADCPKKVSPLDRRDTRSLGAVTRRASLLVAALLPLLCAAAAVLPARSSVAESLPNLGANIKQSSVPGASSGGV